MSMKETVTISGESDHGAPQSLGHAIVQWSSVSKSCVLAMDHPISSTPVVSLEAGLNIRFINLSLQIQFCEPWKGVRKHLIKRVRS